MRLLIFILIILTKPLLAQDNEGDEFKFASYLIDNESYEEASFVLKKILAESEDTRALDSAHFMLGQIYFSQKLLEEAVVHYDKVSNGSIPLSTQSLFYSTLSSSYLGKYSTAALKLKNYNSTDTSLYNLKNLSLAAVSLLDRNFKSYDSLSLLLVKENYLIGVQAEDLNFHKKKLIAVSKKSGLKAGVLSALIPGAGRMYVEKPGQGIYQLIIATILGLQTWESYRKDGVESARFIIYGSLFTSFYIGNIWGSTIGVKLYKNEIKETVDNAILLDMHIPLRTLFR